MTDNRYFGRFLPLDRSTNSLQYSLCATSMGICEARMNQYPRRKTAEQMRGQMAQNDVDVDDEWDAVEKIKTSDVDGLIIGR